MTPLLIPALLVVCWLLTAALCRWGPAAVDVPGERSSHRRPTPRGGGLAFAAPLLVLAGAALVLLPEGRDLWLALLGGVPVAVIGWRDDRRGVPGPVRLIVHFVAAGWAICWLGAPASLTTGLAPLPLGPAAPLLALLGVVWCINLVNFMDGIDGMAAAHVAVVLAAGGALAALGGDDLLALACWLTAAAVAGFLPWNWPPARVFMGGVGSELLGFLVATLALAAEQRGSAPLLVWALLMAVFVVDTTTTLLRRMLRGERWAEPHREHAYQRAVRAGRSHRWVTVGVLLLDVGLVLLAGIAWWNPVATVPLLGLAVVLLVVLCRRL